MAPVDQRAQGLMAGQRGAAPRAQEPEPIAEARRDVLDREHSRARRRQLESERDSVEPPADPADGRRILRRELEAGIDRLEPVEEEMHRLHLRELRERERYFQPIARPAPGFTLQDAEGRRMSLADLRGQVIVLHFIYASCPDVCPLHAEKIAEIQAMVNITPMRELVQFVTITTDPARDSAQVMRDYGPAHGLDAANWTFLTTLPGQPEDTTRQLAEAFGHKFTPTPDGMQMHGIVTHVIEQEGVWRANFHGLEFKPTSLAVFLNALINKAHAPHPPDLLGGARTPSERRTAGGGPAGSRPMPTTAAASSRGG